MSDRETIFRAEAMEYRARMQGPGGLLRLGSRWTSWAFWVLIGLVLAGVGAAGSIHVTRYATGTTATDGEGRLVVLLPAAVAPEIAPGRRVDLGEASTEIVSTDGAVLYPSQVRDRYGIVVTAPSVAVVTSAAGTDEVQTARVLVESEPMIIALVPGLQALFGEDDG